MPELTGCCPASVFFLDCGERPERLRGKLGHACVRRVSMICVNVSGVCVYSDLRVVSAQLCLTPWTVACRAPLSVEFSRQEHWSGLPCNSGDLPDPEIEPESPASPALVGGFFTATPTLTDSVECATFVLGECTGMFASTLGSSDTL